MKTLKKKPAENCRKLTTALKRKEIFFIAICTGFLFIMVSACLAGDLNKNVNEAFKLRMNGKVDEAKAQLDQVLANDSTCALAYYELARTKHHMMLGGSGHKPEDILSTIEKAVKYDPNNVIYANYHANICFLNAYASEEKASEYAMKACSAYETVVKLKPDYKEAYLYLVEFYGLLPAEMGGNKAKAEIYAKKLVEIDDILAAKAQAVLMPDSADKVAFWTDILDNQPKSAEVNEELGKAYIYVDDVENGIKYFEKALTLNPENNLPQLNIARVYVMRLMQNKGDKEKNLELATEAFNKFLIENPGAINPLQAYTKGWIAKVKGFTGDAEGSKKIMAEAKALDPYFSMAFGTPPLNLYNPPEEISHYFGSFFRPF